MTAGRWKNDSSRLDFGVYWNTSSPTQKWYIYLHFAEIQILNQTQVREMQVYVVDKFVQTVTLQYGKPVTVSSFPVSSPDKVNFTIKAPSYSNLPPILNAFEFMSSLDMNPMTVEDDVRAINGIKNAYAVTRDSWQGYPCSPRNFSWIGLNCSYDGNPRITSLNLSSSNLMGEIADAFGNLTSLTSLDLSNNQLTGQIPEYFGQMPALKLLNLNGNNLSGSIPDALKRKQAAGTLHASFEENPNLCQTNICLSRAVGSTGKNGEDSTNLIIPTSVSASLVIFLAIILILWRIRRRSQGGSGEEPLVEGINVASPKKIIFKYSDISTITNNFGTVLGEGGFGKVYLGTLSNGNKVAVKICSKLSSQAYKGFLAEVGMLMTVHHKNLISLVGYCNEIESTVLLYELMSNGDLKQHLSENNADVLSWRQRLSIAIDAAHGIEYLHNGCKPPIIHRDLKTSNILLNENMQAKIADFGLSKIMGMDDDSHICTRPAGTPGYLDPEFHASGRLTKKSDVYSFGIVLLELITGQPAIIKRSLGIVIHIIERVNPLIERGDIRSIVDSRLRGQFKDNAAWKAVEIAMSCVAPSSSRRPDMESVSSDLKECLRLEADSGHDNYMEGTFLGMSHAKLDYTAPEPR
ncbi:hypothetical protein SAY86_031191 [Trapa natans]|uniref:non-specific serine/threonine protein kinase n=1 Tax=Trapa natans TaxID=22666 RepID=A0AAN7M2Z9_TRANT|nr:hypothetical protein SAY86_031191 [Trapa natans]